MYGKIVTFLINFTLFLGISTFSSDIYAGPKVYWMYLNLPPYYIVDQKSYKLTGGILADLQELYITLLPEYEHVDLYVNIKRAVNNIKAREQNYVFSGFYKTPEREKIMNFSIPHVVSEPRMLFIRERDYLKFGGEKSVSLNELVKGQQIRIGLSDNRSYGNKLDQIIMKGKKGVNVFRYKGRDFSKQLFGLLADGKIDCTVGYTHEFKRILGSMGTDVKFRALEIEEDNEYGVAYLAAPKNAFGAKFVADFNSVIRDIVGKKEYLNIYMKYTLPERKDALVKAIRKKIK